MGFEVTTGAMLQCTQGLAPAPLNVLPVSRVTAGGTPAANIMDNKPFVNIMPFGVCRSLANPATAALTAAALGALVPGPCTPVTPAPWAPGSPTVLIGGMPALNNASQCMCVFGGQISVIQPSNTTVTVP